MGTDKKGLNPNEAWKLLLNKYDIEEQIHKNGFFNITANDIKEFKEPRLMAKWDSTESLPDVLRRKKINILPISRGKYVLSDFKLYKEIPCFANIREKIVPIQLSDDYETVNIQDISSESNAINVLLLTNALDMFLETDGTVETFNGRMGTGQFSFLVDSFSGVKRSISVDNAQCEIDGGFENEKNVVIMEAKNVLHDDFHVRQLYYPYRLWKAKVKKPIRLVFSQYSNKVFRMFEYQFEDLEDYSSLVLLNEKYYSLDPTNITSEDLIQVKRNATIKYDDHYEEDNKNRIPFPQADSMERVISLMEHLYDNPMTKSEVAKFMNFEERQSDYYFNALRYLRLADRADSIETGERVYQLTALGNEVFRLNYRTRQLKIVECILEHQIFNDLFSTIQSHGVYPTKTEIQCHMIKYNVVRDANADSLRRRSSTVSGWLQWIFNLPTL